jgi:hypothetical protein
MTNIEKFKLIADFMEMEYDEERSLNKFMYDWSWLVPVIEKIRRSYSHILHHKIDLSNHISIRHNNKQDRIEVVFFEKYRGIETLFDFAVAWIERYNAIPKKEYKHLKNFLEQEELSSNYYERDFLQATLFEYDATEDQQADVYAYFHHGGPDDNT